jgi:hypothetical protein
LEDSIDETWKAYASEIKASVWDLSPEAIDLFHDKFSPITGEVVPGWNAHEWQLGITGGVMLSTRGCHTVTHPRGGE